MNFTVIDVETANEDYGSICAIGCVRYRDGRPEDEFYTLCNPEEEFTNTWLHGISERDVATAVLLEEALKQLGEFIGAENRLVSHMPFDKTAVAKASVKSNVNLPDWEWYDSAKAVRRAWAEYHAKGYGLKKITKVLGITFEHHNALEDAKAAGQVMIAAFDKWDGEKHELWEQIGSKAAKLQRKAYYEVNKANPVPNIEGEFYGQNIAFTGTLDSMTRTDAKALAASVGFAVGGVTKKTNLLVTGQASILFAKSSKLLKAKKAIQEGQDMRIVGEDDFLAMVS